MKHLVALVLAVACLSYSPRHAVAGDTLGTQQLQSSLGLVIGYKNNKIRIGSAFCVYSDDSRSLYATNKHVVDGFSTLVIIRQFPNKERYRAKVIATGNGNRDLAIIEIARGNVPVVTASTITYKDENVATIGYPIAGRLPVFDNKEEENVRPTYTAGRVEGYDNDGFYIRLGMQVIHGNSGGPLFDTTTQRVVGIITASGHKSGEAIPISQLLYLAQQAGYPNVAHSENDSTASEDSRRSGRCPKDIIDLLNVYKRWSAEYQIYGDQIHHIGSAMNELAAEQNENSITREEILVNNQVRLTNDLMQTYEPPLVAALKHIETNDSHEAAIASYKLVIAVQYTDEDNARWAQEIQRSVYSIAAGGEPIHIDRSYIDAANTSAAATNGLATNLLSFLQCVNIRP